MLSFDSTGKTRILHVGPELRASVYPPIGPVRLEDYSAVPLTFLEMRPGLYIDLQ